MFTFQFLCVMCCMNEYKSAIRRHLRQINADIWILFLFPQCLTLNTEWNCNEEKNECRMNTVRSVSDCFLLYTHTREKKPFKRFITICWHTCRCGNPIEAHHSSDSSYFYFCLHFFHFVIFVRWVLFSMACFTVILSLQKTKKTTLK